MSRSDHPDLEPTDPRSVPAKDAQHDRKATKDNDRDDNAGAQTTLYVNGLAPAVTLESFTNLFSPFGQPESVRLVTDPFTDTHRGFGFVSFTEEASALAAIEALNKKEVMGKSISVEKARRDRPRSPTPGRFYGPGGASRREEHHRDVRRREGRRREPRRAPTRQRSRSQSQSRRMRLYDSYRSTGAPQGRESYRHYSPSRSRSPGHSRRSHHRSPSYDREPRRHRRSPPESGSLHSRSRPRPRSRTPPPTLILQPYAGVYEEVHGRPNFPPYASHGPTIHSAYPPVVHSYYQDGRQAYPSHPAPTSLYYGNGATLPPSTVGCRGPYDGLSMPVTAGARYDSYPPSLPPSNMYNPSAAIGDYEHRYPPPTSSVPPRSQSPFR